MRLGVVVQHHPARAGLLERLLDHLEPGVVILEDPDPDGPPAPWRTYRRCLEFIRSSDEPMVILQDDATVIDRFEHVAGAAVAGAPGLPLALFCGDNLPPLSRSRYLHAASYCERYVALDARDWTPAVALVWTPPLAARLLAHVHPDATKRQDDQVISDWLQREGLEAWATIPNLVQHPDDTKSLLTGTLRRRRRQALCYPPDGFDVEALWE